MKRLLLIFIAGISFALPCKAESTSDTKSGIDMKASSKRTCRIVFPERPNNLPKFAYLYDGKNSQRVTLPSMNFSKVIDLPSGELTLSLTPSEITDPENLPQNAPKLIVPEDVVDFYIILSSSASNALLQVQLELVNLDNRQLQPGQTLWKNLTDHRIRAELGTKKMSVEPKRETVSYSPVSESGYYRAKFDFQPHGQGNFYKFTEQQWWHDIKSRHVGFIVPTGGRLPKIYYYRDFRQ